MIPFRPDQVLEFLYTALENEILNMRGSLSRARDPYEALELLLDAPHGLRVVLSWAGDRDLTEEPRASVVRHSLEVFIVQSRGLRIDKGAELSKPDPTQAPLLLVVSQVRSLVRSIQFPGGSTDQYLQYRSTEPVVTPDGMPLNAYKLLFELDAPLPAQEYQQP